jgi:hypothetical protein
LGCIFLESLECSIKNLLLVTKLEHDSQNETDDSKMAALINQSRKDLRFTILVLKRACR